MGYIRLICLIRECIYAVTAATAKFVLLCHIRLFFFVIVNRISLQGIIKIVYFEVSNVSTCKLIDKRIYKHDVNESKPYKISN